jgi:hypothetical protein
MRRSAAGRVSRVWTLADASVRRGVSAGPLPQQVSPVTAGRRYAFLPFVYDEAAAKIREENTSFLEGDASGYKADTTG